MIVRTYVHRPPRARVLQPQKELVCKLLKVLVDAAELGLLRSFPPQTGRNSEKQPRAAQSNSLISESVENRPTYDNSAAAPVGVFPPPTATTRRV